MLRYMRALSDKDLAMDRTMIPLGSCTMKLNATSRDDPGHLARVRQLHPFAPADADRGLPGTDRRARSRCWWNAPATTRSACNPTPAAQGEYAGLLAIRAYHASRAKAHRDVCLIPDSAHGTNPASAQMCGMQVVVTKTDANGNVDVEDIRRNAEKHSERLAAIMMTYPSTHGVFEEDVVEICDIIHTHGGQVYTDGANMNALVGLAKPGQVG
jgi:glycine dehydrogenase